MTSVLFFQNAPKNSKLKDFLSKKNQAVGKCINLLTRNDCRLVDVDDVDPVEVPVGEGPLRPGEGQQTLVFGVGGSTSSASSGGELEGQGLAGVPQFQRDEVVVVVEPAVVEDRPRRHLGGELQANVELKKENEESKGKLFFDEKNPIIF